MEVCLSVFWYWCPQKNKEFLETVFLVYDGISRRRALWRFYDLKFVSRIGALIYSSSYNFLSKFVWGHLGLSHRGNINWNRCNCGRVFNSGRTILSKMGFLNLINSSTSSSFFVWHYFLTRGAQKERWFSNTLSRALQASCKTPSWKIALPYYHLSWKCLLIQIYINCTFLPLGEIWYLTNIFFPHVMKIVLHKVIRIHGCSLLRIPYWIRLDDHGKDTNALCMSFFWDRRTVLKAMRLAICI